MRERKEHYVHISLLSEYLVSDLDETCLLGIVYYVEFFISPGRQGHVRNTWIN